MQWSSSQGGSVSILKYFKTHHYDICGNRDMKRKSKDDEEEATAKKKKKESEKNKQYWKDLAEKAAPPPATEDSSDEEIRDPDLLSDNSDIVIDDTG